MKNPGTALNIKSISEYTTEQEALIVLYCCFHVVRMEREVSKGLSTVVYLDLEECNIPELPQRTRTNDDHSFLHFPVHLSRYSFMNGV